ncbi:MAG: DUF4286 family protein [Chitinophagaceae bacterium]|nr:MAG: DUF4286 family protein [Chitinophagaceae bacterium]
MKLPYIEVENQDDGQLIYNVTTKVDHSIARQWLAWMKEEHIPDILATGCFTDAQVLQLTEVDESDGPTYAVQYSSPGRDRYNEYITGYAEQMRKKAADRWGALIISFRSVLRVVN